MDIEELDFQLGRLKLRGVKGLPVHKQALWRFLTVIMKNKGIGYKSCKKMGFEKSFLGQTYPRKLDSQILNVLSQIAESAHKFSNDIRLLQSLKEN